MGFAHFIAAARVEKDTLGECGFARIDMRHNTYITGARQRECSFRHCFSTPD
jgi:hypothetical protein